MRAKVQVTITTRTIASVKPTAGDSTMPEAVLSTPAQTIAGAAGLGDAGAEQAADERVRARGWDAADPGDDVPDDRAHERAEHHPGVDDARLDDALADRLGDVEAEEQEGDEVEERRPQHRVARAQHARRDDGRDRVRGVVQPVQEIEQQGDEDQPDEQGEADDDGVHARPQTCSVTMLWISFATSSRLSATFSK